MQTRWPSVLMVLLLLSVFASAALAEDVGQFTRVVNQVDQLKKGKEPAVPAKVPGGVENQDMVRTGDRALAVVQFVDESTMTISPKSKVTIEDYMYDAGKGKSKGTIKVMEGVVETIIPTTDKLQQKDIQIRTTTAIAGIRGTKLITVVKPEGTVFYVVPEEKEIKPEKTKIRIRMFTPECQPDAPSVKFVSESLKKKMPIRQIVEDALAAGLDPCDVIRAAILLGVDLEQLIANFHQVCSADPELKNICTPCLILKCTVEALRCLKDVDVAAGQYGILLKKLAPIMGDINLEDLKAILDLAAVGAEGKIPSFPPDELQIYQAKLPGEANRIVDTLVKFGVPRESLSECYGALIGKPPTLTYTPTTTSTITQTVGGGGGEPPEASRGR